jgi:hypothetical protein
MTPSAMKMSAAVMLFPYPSIARADSSIGYFDWVFVGGQLRFYGLRMTTRSSNPT